MYFHSYLASARQILDQYRNEERFSSYVKKYFSQNKKFGSRDRKHISHLCYCYFRLGKAFGEVFIEQRIVIGLFLCSHSPNEILEHGNSEWNQHARASLWEKWTMAHIGSSIDNSIKNVFPWGNDLSPDLDHELFCASFFTQPDLFLRLRPGYENSVKEKLSLHKTEFKEVGHGCLALPNGSAIDDVIEPDLEAVVQDYSSQRTGDIFRAAIRQMPPHARVWDCCAGSGGKSILLYDIEPMIDLTVSDIRKSILANLEKRFLAAGIKKYKSFIADLAQISPNITEEFDLVICDVPCTGSGTWSRTPEQVCFFDEKAIEKYASLQKKIVSNVASCLKNNGLFVYITCSIFRKENEEVINHLVTTCKLRLIDKQLLAGYGDKADTMFIALLSKGT